MQFGTTRLLSQPARLDVREAFAAWVALVAPGTLTTRLIILLPLVCLPWVTPLVIVTPVVRLVAAALCVVHVASAVLLMRDATRRWLVLAFLGLLMVDAFLCGVLVAVEPRAPAVLLGVAVLVMSLEVGGVRTTTCSVFAAGVGAVAALWLGMSAVLFPQAVMSFPVTLSVDTTFAGRAALAVPAVSFPTALSVEMTLTGVPGLAYATTLSVETLFGGLPAIVPAEEIFAPAVAVVLIALSVGMATNWRRARRARVAVAASIVAAARVVP